MRVVDLVVDSTALFALSEVGWNLGSRAVHRIAKDGSGVTQLTRFKDFSESSRLLADSNGLYFTKLTGSKVAGRAQLFRLARDGGPAELVTDEFGWLGGVYDG